MTLGRGAPSAAPGGADQRDRETTEPLASCRLLGLSLLSAALFPRPSTERSSCVAELPPLGGRRGVPVGQPTAGGRLIFAGLRTRRKIRLRAITATFHPPSVMGENDAPEAPKADRNTASLLLDLMGNSPPASADAPADGGEPAAAKAERGDGKAAAGEEGTTTSAIASSMQTWRPGEEEPADEPAAAPPQQPGQRHPFVQGPNGFSRPKGPPRPPSGAEGGICPLCDRACESHHRSAPPRR